VNQHAKQRKKCTETPAMLSLKDCDASRSSPCRPCGCSTYSARPKYLLTPTGCVAANRHIFAAVPSDSLIATSSSGILISDIQDAAAYPERVLLGHPFNPPHLIPLVEVVGGRLTCEDAIKKALAFYGSIGKKPIRIRREVKGHIANRLQAALWREAFFLVEQGIASVEDVDTAIAHGPGLRWALLGPFLNLHLSGGAGGIAHVLEHLGPPIESWWRDLGENGKT